MAVPCSLWRFHSDENPSLRYLQIIGPTVVGQISRQMADSMSIDKKELDREGLEDSMDSTPEAETGAPQESAAAQQKRKGGRKPVRALSCHTNPASCH